MHWTCEIWTSSKRLDVSRIFVTERGKDRYVVVAHPDFHDWWLHCDGQLYCLGGSVMDAALKSDFAIGKIDPTPKNLTIVDDLVTSGTELVLTRVVTDCEAILGPLFSA